MRRLRGKLIQPLVREHTLSKEDLVAPLFIDETAESPVPILSMPGQVRYPPKGIALAVEQLKKKGIRAVLLFGIPGRKDATASEAYNPTGVIQEGVRSIKALIPDMVVITDVCACEYTDHGHCGVIGDGPCGLDLLNDPSLELMAQIAVSHARAGADIVAPSCMLDGMVAHIRKALDDEGFLDTAIMSYSTKFASALYGPFRDAAESPPKFGDRKSHQMDPANVREALRESALDVEEGADMLMVKPALPYLDVIRRVHEAFPNRPLAAYNVSGEYAMIKAASLNGWLDERNATLEALTGIKRAGADLILTYHAKDAARWLRT